MPELIRIDLPRRGCGFTLRQRLGPGEEQVAFLGPQQRVWLFREVSTLTDFLASEASPAPQWRALFADGHTLDPEQAVRYNLWQMIDGTLRWGLGYEAEPCNELCIELAFSCNLTELLDELGPNLRILGNSRWRRVITLLGSRIHFWGEEDTGPIDLTGIPSMIFEDHISTTAAETHRQREVANLLGHNHARVRRGHQR